MSDEPALARYLGRLSSFAKVLAFDKRGTGVSDPVALHALPTIEQWMDDARVALDAAGIDRTAVIGDTEGRPIAAMYRWVTDLDVRSVLPSIHAPTLVVSRSDAQHHRPAFSRYLADHIPDAEYVELPGADTFPFQTGDFDQVLDKVEQFLTGSEPAPNVDRVLGTIVFTDIVASTQVVTAIGDSAWLALRRTHDDLVRENIRRHRGREISHTGDGFLALFDGRHGRSPVRRGSWSRFAIWASRFVPVSTPARWS